MILRAPRISKRKQNILFRCFISDMGAYCACYGEARCAARRAKVNKNTAALWYRHWREAIYRASAIAPRFVGAVEMDQKQFGGRGRKRMQTLLARYKKVLPYNEYQAKAAVIRGRNKTRVFGILERDSQRVYCKIIRREDKRTLMPIIRLVVVAGGIIYTDQWRGFADLGIDGYTHTSINHSEEYVDKQGHHANTIESFWSFASRRLAKFNGIPAATIVLHIKECEFRWNHRADLISALKAILH